MIEKYQKLLRAGVKVFDVKDMAILLTLPLPSARVVASRLTSKGILRRLRKDLYTLREIPLDDFAIANRLLSPSYISFESALNYWGISTQIPRSITSAARRSKTYLIEKTEFCFFQMPTGLFSFGHKQENNFFIATPEKAVLDTAYYASLGRKMLSDELDFTNVNRTILMQLAKKYPPPVKQLLQERTP